MMPIANEKGFSVQTDGLFAPGVVVAGLRWDPADELGDDATAFADLDLACILLDSKGNVVEFVDPRNTRSKEASVIHTGDSRTGAGAWDDERVFVFLRELPPSIAAVMFVVSAEKRSFCDTRNASCHVTNHIAEEELLRVEITALGNRQVHCFATLRRADKGWQILPGAREDMRAAELIQAYRPLFK